MSDTELHADDTVAWAVIEPGHRRTVVLRRNGHWWSDFDVDDTGISGFTHSDADVTVEQVLS